jgi:hypothetical protein
VGRGRGDDPDRVGAVKIHNRAHAAHVASRALFWIWIAALGGYLALLIAGVL